MLIEAGRPRDLGVESGSYLRIGEDAKPEGSWAGTRRLWVRDRPVFTLTYWCGTCPFLFHRTAPVEETGSIAGLAERLAAGLDSVDDEVVARFGALLPRDRYLPLLLGVAPRLIEPPQPGDYFAEEQVHTWGDQGAADEPEAHGQPYYRGFETAVDADGHLFEFVVPMVPPSWNDRERVRQLGEVLAGSDRPTAVAVSLLDISQPVWDDGPDVYAHWCLAHFLLDGHHKVEAAAAAGRPLRLLSLLATGASLAGPKHIGRVPRLLDRAPGGRVAPPAATGSAEPTPAPTRLGRWLRRRRR